MVDGLSDFGKPQSSARALNRQAILTGGADPVAADWLKKDLALEASGVSKSFGGIAALVDVNFDLRAGEVHALVGENGAGKSTLMKILAGVHVEYDGAVRLAGAPVKFAGVQDAERAGVAIIHQELDLVPELTAADNIFLGREPLIAGNNRRPAPNRQSRRRAARPAQYRHRPASPRRGSARRRTATRRDRQGAVAGRAHPDDGRADVRAVVGRVQNAVQGRAPARRRGRRDHLHFASHRRGRGACRSRHRVQRRPSCPDRAHRAALVERDHLGDGRTGHRADASGTRGGRRRACAVGARPHARYGRPPWLATRPSRGELRAAARRDPRNWRPARVRDAPRSSSRSSGRRAAGGAARSPSTASRPSSIRQWTPSGSALRW